MAQQHAVAAQKLLLVQGKIRAAEKFGSSHRREASTSMAHRTHGFWVEHREASTSMAHRTDIRVVQLRVVREVAIRGIARQLMRFLRVCEVSSFRFSSSAYVPSGRW